MRDYIDRMWAEDGESRRRGLMQQIRHAQDRLHELEKGNPLSDTEREYDRTMIARYCALINKWQDELDNIVP